MARTRREFLENVGGGMLLAGLGSTLAGDLGIRCVQGAEDEKPLVFGEMEPLVALMQETPPGKLIGVLVEKLAAGTDLKTLVAAGALANARTFGGEDYVGFHTFMALAPAYRMAGQLPSALRPLPVLKVLYRNAGRIQDFGGRPNEVLHVVDPVELPTGQHPGEHLRSVVRLQDKQQAERTFAALQNLPVGEAFNHLQYAVDDEVDVHRVVLAWRAMDTLELAGERWAHCLLRQSIRYCANTEQRVQQGKNAPSAVRTVLPQLLDQYSLLGKAPGNNSGDDSWLRQLAETIFRGSREQAADAAAQALAEGYAPDAVGEAISVAANMLVLHDPGRPEKWASPEKPAGSCHGDSVGVHASDAANAWRNIARVSHPRNTLAGLIVGAFHTGGQSGTANGQPYPTADQLAEVRPSTAKGLLEQAEQAIRAKDQSQAAAVVARYGQLGFEAERAFQLLLKFATSEDGALHAEKYYNTAWAEFAATRPTFRWGQLVALARVTASQYGYSSPGYEEAKKRLVG